MKTQDIARMFLKFLFYSDVHINPIGFNATAFPRKSVELET
jgi:hypothetical protein